MLYRPAAQVVHRWFRVSAHRVRRMPAEPSVQRPAAHMLHSPCCTRPISPCTEPCTKALLQPCVQGLYSPCAAGVVHRWCTGGAHRMRSRCTCHVQPLLHTCCTALAVQGQLALVQSLVQGHCYSLVYKACTALVTSPCCTGGAQVVHRWFRMSAHRVRRMPAEPSVQRPAAHLLYSPC